MKAFLIAAIIAGVLKWHWGLADYLLLYWFLLVLSASIVIPKVFLSPSKKAEPKQAVLNSGAVTESELSNEEIVETDLHELDGPDFIRLVAMYYLDKGYSVQLTSGPGDHEVDLILTDPATKRKIAVQCKYWNTENVGNDKILRLGAGKRIHECQDAWCITTGNYTTPAKETAKGLNIQLINGKNLEGLIEKWQKMKMRAS
jgi:restriction system protein